MEEKKRSGKKGAINTRMHILALLLRSDMNPEQFFTQLHFRFLIRRKGSCQSFLLVLVWQ